MPAAKSPLQGNAFYPSRILAGIIADFNENLSFNEGTGGASLK